MRNRTVHQIELLLIRHGKTPSNMENRYLGRTEEALSPEGRTELLQRQTAGYYPAAGIVFASPMIRCRQTAELLYPGHRIHLIEGFREMDFGAFEGKNYRELQGDKRYQRWIDSNGTLPFPEGESREDFTERCRSGFLEMLAERNTTVRAEERMIGKTLPAEQTADVQSRTVLVVHGGTIMALLSSYGSGTYFDYQCKNGEGYRCTLVYGQEKNGTLICDTVSIIDIRCL